MTRTTRPSRRTVLRTTLALASAAALAWPCGAQADTFPSKPITMVVPFAAGSGSDVSARMYCQYLSQDLKQTIIVDNRPGGSGTVAVEYVTKAPADGYTLLFLGGGSMTQTFFSRKLNFDMLRDLTPVVQLSRGEMFLVVPTSLGVNNMNEFLALVRKNPGKYNYASIAATQMMPMEVLKDRAKIDLSNVPFKNTGQVQQSIENKDVVAYVGNSLGYENLFQQNKLRYLMVFGNERNPTQPDVPSAAELGFQGVHSPSTIAVWAPANTPADVVNKLNAGFNGVLKRPEIIEFVRRQGFLLSGGPPRVQSDAIKAEHAFWAQAAKLSNFTPE